MPRKYISKIGGRSYKNYTEETLLQAVNECKNASYRSVTKRYNIPFRTLWNKCKGLHKKDVGGQPVFSTDEEEQIVNYLIMCSDFGMPLDNLDLKWIVKMYLEKIHRTVKKFSNNFPGDDWVSSFLQRNGDVSSRMCQNIKRARAEVDPDTIRRYFNNLKTSHEGVPSSNILNYDETNLSDEPGQKRCIFRRGVKYPERIINFSKGNISLMFSGTANGELLPPFVIYKSQNLWETWCQGGPPGTRFGRSKSRWMDANNFEEWFSSIVILIPWARRKTDRKTIIGDNLSSHLSPTVLQKCSENNITFILLPPNTTDKTQPLDVAFFGPMKRAWRQIMEDYKMKNPTMTSLDKSRFPGLLSRLIEKLGMRSNQNLISGFKACGIYPLDENAVLKKFPKISDSDSSREKLSDAVLQYLKQFKYSPDTQKSGRQSRKRLTVEPGKSISADEIINAKKPPSPQPCHSRAVSLHLEADENASSSHSSDSDTINSVCDSEDKWLPLRKKKRNIFEEF